MDRTLSDVIQAILQHAWSLKQLGWADDRVNEVLTPLRSLGEVAWDDEKDSHVLTMTMVTYGRWHKNGGSYNTTVRKL